MINTVVGSYKITKKIGEGGMGAVYKGVDLMLEREVAIKMLRPELSRQPQIVERFRTEAVTLAKLNHPNIATLYSFLRQGDDFFMVMEFVPGDTLDKVIQKEGAMSRQRAVTLFCQALEGIEHAHRQGIVHRDIKPANMMLTREGTLKVMDFGIARVLGSARMTKQGNIIGTIEYMSPEQVRGQETDARSDIYSLGILLYEMLTGRVPFTSPSEFELMKNQIEAVPDPPRKFVASIPAGIEQAILKSLAKVPEERFASASEFRAALLSNLEPSATLQASESAAIPETRRLSAAPFGGSASGPKETRLAGTSEQSQTTSPGVAKETRIASDLATTENAAPGTRAGVSAAPPSLLQKLNWKYAAAGLVLSIALIGIPAALLNRSGPDGAKTDAVQPGSVPTEASPAPAAPSPAASSDGTQRSPADQTSPDGQAGDAPKIVKPAGLDALSDSPAQSSNTREKNKKSKSARTKEEERRRAAALKALDKE